MKKIIVLLLSLILFACNATSANNQISNGDDVIYKSPNGNFTKSDLYSALKGLNYDGILVTNIIYDIAQLDNMDLTAATESAESTMDLYKQLYGIDNFDDFGGEEYFKKQLIADEILHEKAKEMVSSDIDNNALVDVPIKAKVAYFDDLEVAQSVVDAVNEGSTFEMAATEAGFMYQIIEDIYLDSNETLPLEVKEYINSTSNNGLSTIIMTQTSTVDADGKEVMTPRYYLLDITSRDYKEFLDDYLSLKAENIDEKEVIKYVIKDHDVKFYDEDTYNKLKTNYEGVFE